VAALGCVTATRLSPTLPEGENGGGGGGVELVLELLGEPNGRRVRMRVLPCELLDPLPSASPLWAEEGGSKEDWWGCCQTTTNVLALQPLSSAVGAAAGGGSDELIPPALSPSLAPRLEDLQELLLPSPPTLLLVFTEACDASRLMDALFYLHRVVPPKGSEDAEEEEEEAREREDYDEKCSFSQAEYWECFHQETGEEECFEWYSAEELQRNCLLRGFRAFISQAEAQRSAADPVFRILDIGAGTSELLFNLAEAFSVEAKTNGRPFRFELWGIDFSHRAVNFLRGQKWARVTAQHQQQHAGGLFLTGEC